MFDFRKVFSLAQISKNKCQITALSTIYYLSYLTLFQLGFVTWYNVSVIKVIPASIISFGCVDSYVKNLPLLKTPQPVLPHWVTVNVSVLVVLIFSQNFSTNGPYVVLNFCKFSDYMVLIFEKKFSHCILCISDR